MTNYMPQITDSKGRFLYLVHCAKCGITYELWSHGNDPTFCSRCGDDWIAVKDVREVE